MLTAYFVRFENICMLKEILIFIFILFNMNVVIFKGLCCELKIVVTALLISLV